MEKALYIKIDQFEEIEQTILLIKKKVAEARSKLQQIRDLKEDEEQRLLESEDRLNGITNRLDEILGMMKSE